MQQPKTSKTHYIIDSPDTLATSETPTWKHPLGKENTPKLFLRTMTWKHGIVLERFCLNAKISAMMTNHQNPSNAQRDFKDNKPQILTEKVGIGLTLRKRLHQSAPPPAPSVILFQTLKLHFARSEVRMHVGMWLIVKTTNQPIAFQPSNKSAKASHHISRKQNPKNQKVSSFSSALFPLPRFATHLSKIFLWDPLRIMGAKSEKSSGTNFKILQHNIHKSKDIVMASLLRDSNIKSSDILAIQEPWRNIFTPTTTAL